MPAFALSLGTAFKVAIMAELLANAGGIGGALARSRAMLDVAQALAWVSFVVVALVVVEYGLICQRRSKNRPRGDAKVGHCDAGLRPPGGLKPERGFQAGVAISREVFSLPFGRGLERDDSCRRSSRGC